MLSTAHASTLMIDQFEANENKSPNNMFLAAALKESAVGSIRRRIRKSAQCNVCADLDIKNPEAWSTGSERGKEEAFDHLFCTRSVTRSDLLTASGAGCTVCAAFLAAIADLEGDEISIRILPDKGVDDLVAVAKRHQATKDSENPMEGLKDLYGPLGKYRAIHADVIVAAKVC